VQSNDTSPAVGVEGGAPKELTSRHRAASDAGRTAERNLDRRCDTVVVERPCSSQPKMREKENDTFKIVQQNGDAAVARPIILPQSALVSLITR